MQKLIVLQGPSGSGKTSLGKKLAAELGGLVFSTDDLFHVADVYEFDPTMLGVMHRVNLWRATKALDRGRTVIVDNTNICCWEARPYVQAAVELGVEVEFIRCHGRYANVHGVPDEKVEDMRRRMETLSVEACCAALAPWEIQGDATKLAV